MRLETLLATSGMTWYRPGRELRRWRRCSNCWTKCEMETQGAKSDHRRLLDREHLKAVPDTLESLISEKRLLQASVLLTRSGKLINKGEFMELGALTDLRSYLAGQETVSETLLRIERISKKDPAKALREILVEELQNHLYLKVYWCDNRWSSYTPGQSRCMLH